MDFDLSLINVLQFLLFSACLFMLMITTIIRLITKPYPDVKRFVEEEYFYDSIQDCKEKFPSIYDPQTLNLTIVVPAYNEEERLPLMLDEVLVFLELREKINPNYKYEIIIVSDGSKDGTVKVAESYSKKYGCDKIRCLNLLKNRGKGGAVRLGVQSSRGAVILFADADGASKFEDITKLECELKKLTGLDPDCNSQEIADTLAIVIGSRAHLEKESLAKRSLFRNILMYGFQFLVWLFTVKGIKDTQCGFKMFTRKAAEITFQNLHVNRWAFDVELLYISQKLNIPISEVQIRWTEIEGSKVTPVLSWIQMGCDLGLIWLKYKIGAWKIKYNKI